MTPRGTVAILFGGRSSEHEVSCTTAAGVLGAIDRDKWDVLAVGIGRDGSWTVQSDNPAEWAVSDGLMAHVEPSERSVLLPATAGDRQWRVEVAGVAEPLALVHVVPSTSRAVGRRRNHPGGARITRCPVCRCGGARIRRWHG